MLALAALLLIAAYRPQLEPNEFTNARAVLAAQVAAWNRGDLDGFMAGYWKNDSLRFLSGGTVTTGWQATLDRYKKRYQSDGREMGKLTFSGLVLQTLGARPGQAGDTVLVSGRWEVVTKEGASAGLFSVILSKFPVRDNLVEWKIVHDHTSAADPPKKP